MIHAKKSYGQHFLTRHDIAERIADSLKLTVEHPRVLEVGPGRGMLTKFLMDKPYQLNVVEADPDMIDYLKNFFPLSSDQIFFRDFLKLDLNTVFDGKSFCLIGNFPYNISSQIIFRMIENRTLIPEMVGMFQLEVAERIVSPPGSKDYGILSVLAQAFYDGKKLFNVDKGSFNPPPKVQSAVIRLVRKENQDLGCNEKLFKRVVKQSFSQRRKMLRNTLKPFFDKDPSVLTQDFYTKRPETLGLEEFVRITQLIETMNVVQDLPDETEESDEMDLT